MFSRRLLYNMMNIVTCLRRSRSPLQFVQRFRLVQIGSYVGVGFIKPGSRLSNVQERSDRTGGLPDGRFGKPLRHLLDDSVSQPGRRRPLLRNVRSIGTTAIRPFATFITGLFWIKTRLAVRLPIPIESLDELALGSVVTLSQPPRLRTLESTFALALLLAVDKGAPERVVLRLQARKFRDEALPSDRPCLLGD